MTKPQKTPAGAPDIDPEELIAKAVNALVDRQRIFDNGIANKLTGEQVADEVLMELRSNGCSISTPQRFTPTPADFAFTAYGVSLSELGEDSDSMIALGHVEPRRMLAALNRYWRKFCGLDYADIKWAFEDSVGSTQVKHRWVQFTRNPHADGGDFEFEWMAWPAPAPNPGDPYRFDVATPVTRWEA
ncbi:hypothetical protein CH273_25605 [Rhodococcus sp. 05-339-2]|uniref:hypothetical protein n=1 Tax=Rhodococcoides fascians TaxID=1828 RepID=UPI00050C6C29|nr:MULTISPECIES: hypothetical protein [Rhodococcus]OZD74869.1 hypothetical protein CH273_25605 [Rhodococcus sp. 05-339-2]